MNIYNQKVILLLNPPAKKRYNRDVFCSGSTKGDYCWCPTDLLVLSGILNEKYDVRVLDAMPEMLSEDFCLAYINHCVPDIIIVLTGYASWDEEVKFLTKVKKEYPCKLIGIGGSFMFDGMNTMKQNPLFDACLLSFLTDDVCKYIEGKKRLKNMIVRKGKKLIYHKIKVPCKVDYPLPRHEMFPLKQYRLPIIRQHPFANILTSLGCVNHCKFCCFGTGIVPYGYRGVDNIIDEIKYVRSIGVKELRFMDYSITINKKLIKELCHEMIRQKLVMPWHALSHINEVDANLLDFMKAAGCTTLAFGVESADQEVLDAQNKGTTVTKIELMFDYCQKIGIKTLAHFVIGLPGQDEDSVRRTIDFSLSLNCDYADFGMITPAIGSQLRDEAISKGWVDKKYINSIYSDAADYPIMRTDKLSKKQIFELKNEAVRKFFFRLDYIYKRLLNTRSWQDFKVQAQVAISFVVKMRRGR